jgi:hypothetical protein
MPGNVEWDKLTRSLTKDGGGYVPPIVPREAEYRQTPSLNDFKLLKTLGRGAFGKVKRI